MSADAIGTEEEGRHCATRRRDNFCEEAMSKTLGDAFEEHALEFLRGRRMRLVARNVRCRGGEIDLVMRDERGALVFVEVRARKSRRFADAAASIGVTKRARLIRAAEHYLASWRGVLPVCRFDVVAFDAGRIRWIPDAFRADGS
jgi:putative endonuclease